MDFGCIEVVAKRQKNKALSAVKTILVAVSAACILLGIGNFILLIPGVAAAAGAYFADLYTYVDYEYALVDKELRIARILKKSRRKHLATYDLEKMEMLAPADSDDIAYLKNRQDNVMDYSDGNTDNKKDTWYLFLAGNTRLILTLPAESAEARKLLTAVRTFAPRIVASV